MTNTFKRRVCRLILLSVTCLLFGILLSDLEDIGITNFQLDLASFILLFAGIIIAFKALETWSFWNEGNSEDKNENQRTRNPYPIAFYTEAVITILITFSPLVFILVTTPHSYKPGASGMTRLCRPTAFKPSSRIFLLPLWSLSMTRPHRGHS